MAEFDFTLRFQLPGAAIDPDELARRLLEAGCDDALLGIGLPGRIALHFTRDASSAHAAIAGAISDVRRAVPGAILVEACPDLVGLTDVADLVGVSRQNLRGLMLRHPATFPVPVHEGNPSIWHLAAILQWLADRAGYEIDEHTLEIARATMQVNIAREALHLSDKARREWRALVG
jgi:predicted DNA-binding transcriptional regulator AlpA